MKTLRLVRTVPGPGIAARTGMVAEAVIFEDGVAVLHWRTAPAGTEIYGSEDQMRIVRESSGRSHFEEE